MFNINWKRIRQYAERKEHEAWMRKYHYDIKCPKCHTWQSTTGMIELLADVPFSNFDTLCCGRCHQRTVYFDTGFMGARIRVCPEAARRGQVIDLDAK